MTSSLKRLLLLVLVANTASAGVPVIAEALANECRFKEALEIFEVTGGFPRGDEEIAIIRGRLLLQLDRFDEAVRVTSSSDWTSADLLLIRGLALAQQGSSLATQTLQAARDAGADRTLARSASALLALHHFDFARAESILVAVLEEDPGLSGALYNLACLRSLQGRPAESAQLLRRAWATGWRNPMKLRSDPDLHGVRSSGLIGDLLLSSESRCLTW